MIETAASKSFAESKSCSDAALSPSERAEPTQHFETPTERRRYHPLIWLNLVCLDAPIVAITWQALFARSFGIATSRGATLALFLTAWLIYLADRFGDSLSLDRRAPISLRQQFCLRHRRAWLIALGTIALADLLVICTRLDSRALLIGAAVGMFALLYLILNQVRPSLWRILPLKEVSIGFLFAAGAMVGLLRSLTSAAIPAWISFAALCVLNCVSIAVWESELDLAQSRISIATVHPEIERAILWLLLALIAISLALVRQTAADINACVAASAILLTLVHVFRNKIESNIRTALADLVLLTPLILGSARALQNYSPALRA
ncbi:MAG: hypothetical protein ACXWHF_02780 [Chthoniobacterales bacterium]